MRNLLHPARTTPALRDIALLVSRVAIGFVLLAHGWQKFNDYTLDGTAAAFTDMGVPAPSAAALFAVVVELAGGLAILVGLLTPLFAALNAINLLGAFVIVHAQNGVFAEDGGYELVLVLLGGLLVIGALGAGRHSIDELLVRRRHA